VKACRRYPKHEKVGEEKGTGWCTSNWKATDRTEKKRLAAGWVDLRRGSNRCAEPLPIRIRLGTGALKDPEGTLFWLSRNPHVGPPISGTPTGPGGGGKTGGGRGGVQPGSGPLASLKAEVTEGGGQESLVRAPGFVGDAEPCRPHT